MKVMDIGMAYSDDVYVINCAYWYDNKEWIYKNTIGGTL